MKNCPKVSNICQIPNSYLINGQELFKMFRKDEKQEEAAKKIPLQSLMNYILKIVSQQLIMSCMSKLGIYVQQFIQLILVGHLNKSKTFVTF